MPLNVPDEEILNLCHCYGNPVDNIIHYEKINLKKGTLVTGSTRFIDMELREGVSFHNYFWMEGPLTGDKGKQVLL